MSKHYNFQKILFGEITFDDCFHKSKHLIVLLIMKILIMAKYIRYQNVLNDI